MDAKEYLETYGCANLCLNLHSKGDKHPDERIWTTDIIESYHQAKSKEEAEERFNKAVEDYFNTDSTKTVHENLHWAAFGKEEE